MLFLYFWNIDILSKIKSHSYLSFNWQMCKPKFERRTQFKFMDILKITDFWPDYGASSICFGYQNVNQLAIL